MAEQSEAQEKTIDPTPKRLQDAKEEGQILTSKELFVFTSAMSGFLCILLFLFLSSIRSDVSIIPSLGGNDGVELVCEISFIGAEAT